MPSHINNTHCLLLLSSAYRRVVGAACATPRPRRIPYHDVPLRRTTRPPSRAAVAAEVVVRSAAPDADADDARKQYQHRRPSDAARSSKRKKQEQKQKQDAGLPGATQRDARARQGKARRSDRGWMSAWGVCLSPETRMTTLAPGRHQPSAIHDGEGCRRRRTPIDVDMDRLMAHDDDDDEVAGWFLLLLLMLVSFLRVVQQASTVSLSHSVTTHSVVVQYVQYVHTAPPPPRPPPPPPPLSLSLSPSRAWSWREAFVRLASHHCHHHNDWYRSRLCRRGPPSPSPSVGLCKTAVSRSVGCRLSPVVVRDSSHRSPAYLLTAWLVGQSVAPLRFVSPSDGASGAGGHDVCDDGQSPLFAMTSVG
ncbi:uncharacterized protein BKA78DRAFT_57811 [Phyllosticta capitalensis]|uniref:uncharacterized protein n=1 Tax=Phyllosticta capitalensis TaxID=121624 RepID=UPI0031326012